MPSHFALLHDDGSSSALDAAPALDASAPLKYILRGERPTGDTGDAQLQLSVTCAAEHSLADHKYYAAPAERRDDVIAILTVAFPVLKLAACVDGVVVLPGHLVTGMDSKANGDLDIRSSQILEIERSTEACTTFVLLRADDAICFNGARLRVAVVPEGPTAASDAGAELAHVQVDSSIPAGDVDAEDGGGLQSADGAVDARKSGGGRDKRAGRELQVEMSFGAEQVGDSMESSTPPAKPAPVVEETPASRRRYVDAWSNAFDASRADEDDTLAAAGVESQELKGATHPGVVSKAGEKAGVDEIGLSTNAANALSAKEDSLDGQATYVTARSTSQPDRAELGCPDRDVKPKTIRGKKRKSEEELEGSGNRAPKSRTISKARPLDNVPAEQPQEPRWLAKTPTYSKTRRKLTPATSPLTDKSALKTKRVLFSNSNIKDKSPAMDFLFSHGLSRVDNTAPRGFDMLVVGEGELRKTFKLLTAVALRKPVVTDAWVLQSSKADKLLDPSSFLPEDPEFERQWEFALANVISNDRRTLFKGRSILITPALKREYGKKGLNDIEELGKVVGAKKVTSKSFKDAADERNDSRTIVLAADANEPDVRAWRQHGYSCFSKDFLSISILRGYLDVNDDKLKIGGEPMRGRAKARNTAKAA